jgi:lipid-binding SYLF domain-containing protein
LYHKVASVTYIPDLAYSSDRYNIMAASTPTQLQKECGKAATTLQHFLGKSAIESKACLNDSDQEIAEKKIPLEVLANAKGLAIFSAFRAGMWFAGTAGSGIVVARLANGQWSPPSAFSVKSAAFGLTLGIDHFDCVCVLNTQEAVEAYRTSEMTMGGRMDLAAGPVGGALKGGETKPVWTYTRSRGLYGGMTIQGTAIKTQDEANAEFFGAAVSASQILSGMVDAQSRATQWPAGAAELTKVLSDFGNA